jgi:hypothetical protein
MNKNKIIFPIIFFLLFVAFYAILKFIPSDNNDIYAHAAFARQMCTGEIPYTGNFLVYLLVNIFSFFTANVTFTEIVLTLLLAFAGTFKYYLIQSKLNETIGIESLKQTNSWLGILLSISMLFVFAIPIPSYFLGDYFMYIGNYVPNVWHNSTILFLFPLAILLFDLSYKQLQSFDFKRNWLILLVIVLNLFTKPSYFFVFICVYPILLLQKYKFNKEFWFSIIPLAVGFILLIAEYFIIYKTVIPTVKDASAVIFMPFYRNPAIGDVQFIPMSMLFSMLFPLLYSAFNLGRLLKNQLFWYTLLSFITSVLIFFFISESGPRAYHGNFYWQIIITAWICFFVALLALLKDIKIQGSTFKNILLFSVFGIHVLMGVVYFVRILVTGGYY